MQVGVMLGIEDGQENQTTRSGNRKENRRDRAGLVGDTLVRNELSSMTKPSFRQKGQIQKDHGDDTANDEEGLNALGANIRNVPEPRRQHLIPSGPSESTHAICWSAFMLL